ncbi:MAG: FAD-dependent monooxygenase [Pararhodobacter sp.]
MRDAPSAAPLAGRPVTVLGGGIGGLAAALAMKRFGAEVRVLEQAPAIAEVGAGLQISPNGARVLRALKVDPHAVGDAALAVELRDRRGRLVTRLDLRGDPGFFLCHRADLIGVLAARARDAGVSIELDSQVRAVSLGAAGVVSLAGGLRHEAPLLIGADGLRSRLRGVLNTPAAARFTGQVAWRAIIAGDDGASVAQVFMGPGRHLVSYPLRGGRLRNIVAVEERTAWAAEGWHHRDDPAALRAAFAGFGGPVPGWLEAVDEVFLWGLFRHPVADHWHDGQGRAALVGDAAHPTLPFMAQGANMALEDAWVLARCLAGAESQSAALARYQALRRKRCQAIVATAGRNARRYHLHPPMAQIAHAALRVLGMVAPGAPLRRFGWIYDHDVTA